MTSRGRSTTAGPAEAAFAAGGSRVWRATRNTRLVVPVCIVLICGCFGATAILQMRTARNYVLDQAATFEQQRATAIARVAGDNLDRLARIGALFAEDPGTSAVRAEPAIRDIAVFAPDGTPLATLHGAHSILFPVPPAVFAGQRQIIPGGIAFLEGDKAVAVRFDWQTLAPGLLAGAAIANAHGDLLADGGDWRDGTRLTAPLAGWPLNAVTRIDQDDALASFAGSLPLYLFIILGPAVVGGWVAALLVGSFERQTRAAQQLRDWKTAQTAEPKLLLRLANAERAAAEASRAKSEFIAHMSHELRTPLNAVIGFSDMIAQGFFGPTGHPKYSEYARDIGNAGRGLHAKIGDILEFANIEAGRYPLTPARVDLAAMAQACISEQQGRAFSRRIALAAPSCESGLVRADPGALRRILTSLLVNALAYTPQGGRVLLRVHFEAGSGVLTLTDTGPGFGGTERGRAGRPFQRFDRPGAVTGAGLGLAIATELARRMGGTMRLGQPGRGSVMEVRLPALTSS